MPKIVPAEIPDVGPFERLVPGLGAELLDVLAVDDDSLPTIVVFQGVMSHDRSYSCCFESASPWVP